MQKALLFHREMLGSRCFTVCISMLIYIFVEYALCIRIRSHILTVRTIWHLRLGSFIRMLKAYYSPLDHVPCIHRYVELKRVTKQDEPFSKNDRTPQPIFPAPFPFPAPGFGSDPMQSGLHTLQMPAGMGYLPAGMRPYPSLNFHAPGQYAGPYPPLNAPSQYAGHGGMAAQTQRQVALHNGGDWDKDRFRGRDEGGERHIRQARSRSPVSPGLRP